MPAIQGALKKAGLQLSDLSLIEINEAFSAQYLACQKELGFDLEIGNVNGGAIALGHPLAASGTRILLHAGQRAEEKGSIIWCIRCLHRWRTGDCSHLGSTFLRGENDTWPLKKIFYPFIDF